MNKKKFTIFWSCIFCLCSCNVYSEFGRIPKENVKNICESYAERVSLEKKDARYLSICYDLGIFCNDTIYVDALVYSERNHIPSNSIVDFYVDEIYICSLPNELYDLNVWVKMEKSYSLEEAYHLEKVTMADINMVISEAKIYGLYLQ